MGRHTPDVETVIRFCVYLEVEQTGIADELDVGCERGGPEVTARLPA